MKTDSLGEGLNSFIIHLQMCTVLGEELGDAMCEPCLPTGLRLNLRKDTRLKHTYFYISSITIQITTTDEHAIYSR